MVPSVRQVKDQNNNNKIFWNYFSGSLSPRAASHSPASSDKMSHISSLSDTANTVGVWMILERDMKSI